MKKLSKKQMKQWIIKLIVIGIVLILLFAGFIVLFL